jgi:hypothetical protein
MKKGRSNPAFFLSARHGRAFDPAIQAVVESGAAPESVLALDGRLGGRP